MEITCTFNNCNFGIFAENVSVQIKNNTFTNQKYNAIYIKELFDSHIINNEITMTGIYPNVDEVLKVSIQIRNIQDLSAGRDVWILNNTINNSTVGISLLNTSSTAIAATNKYVKIGGNEIYFGAIDQAAGKNYCGIKIQNCNRIRVAGNIIESNTSPWTSWDVKKIVGIHIAQSKETWVADNYSIRNMTAGVYAVGHCTNTQFACNKLFHNNYGIYFEPYNNQVATMISSQGYAGRASDNEWYDYNQIFRIGGNLNMQNYTPNWYFRNDDLLGNTFNPDLGDTANLIYGDIIPIENTNVNSQCAFQMTELPEDMDFGTISGMVRDLRLNDIVMENIEYMILADEFEYFDQQYLYEILYNNPEIMTLGEPHDSAYINFYNYITNTNIREFIELQELIDEGNLNAALQTNGVIVAQNLIETNLIATNNIYLNTLAQDVDLDSADMQNLFVIAMLTPYVGGEGVYSARAMLGIDPEDYNLPYRKGKTLDSIQDVQTNKVKIYPNPAEDILTIEFEQEIENVQLIIFDIVGKEILKQSLNRKSSKISINFLKSGLYYYNLSGYNDKIISGKIIKQ